MKKIYAVVLLFISIYSSGQTNTIVWDWENNATVQRFVNDQCCMLAGGAYVSGVQIPWYATHGCINGCLCIPGERIHIAIDAFNSGNPSGRGFAIQYNFKRGYRYTISIDGSITDNILQGETRPYRPPTMQVGFTNSINIQNNLCTSATIFSLPDLPAGASVTQWSVTPGNIVNLTPNGSQVTLNKVGKRKQL